MRLWLSDKASKQLKGDLPPEEFLECPEHGKQAYVRTPEGLSESLGKWSCGECVRQTTAKAKEAEAAGAYGENVTDPAEVAAALKRGLEQVRAGKPAVISVWLKRLIDGG